MSNQGALYPPISFSMVEEGIYRSGLPTELNFGFLKSLNLKMVVMLSPESVTERFSCFLEDHSIQTKCIESNLSIGIDRSDLSLPIAESTVIDVLKLITNKNNLPILVTCRSGKRITGLIIGCLRKLQRWSLVSILEEYRRLAGHALSKSHQQHEQFIELFDTDLVP